MKASLKALALVGLLSAITLAGFSVVRAQVTTADTEVTIPTATTVDSTTTTTPCAPGARHGARLEEQARLFKMSVADLQKELDAGKTMYQIAAEHGVTYETEKAQHLTNLKTRLDDMVKVGYMTQAQADAAYQQAESSPMVGMGSGLAERGFGHHVGRGL